MEAKGDEGTDRGEGRVTPVEFGLSGWPTDHVEFEWWLVKQDDGGWRPISSMRYGMIYSEDWLLTESLSLEQAIWFMQLHQGE